MTLLMILFWNVMAFSENRCLDLFQAPRATELTLPTPLRAQTEKLAPQLLENINSLDALYLAIAREEARIEALAVLPGDLVDALKVNFSDRYNFPLAPRDQKYFYLNALSSLAGRIAWEWKRQTVEEIIGRTITGKTLLTAQALMDSYYSVQGMSERLSLTTMQEFFSTQPWRVLDWTNTLIVAERWYGSLDSAKGFTAFYKWYESQPDLPALRFEDQQGLYMALMKKPSPVVCCKSSFACWSCPHNRAWLKDEEGL